MKPTLALSLGCPSGIGPEVSIRAALACTRARCLLIGDERVIGRAMALVGGDPARLVRIQNPIGEVATWARRDDNTLAYISPKPPLALDDAPYGRPSAAAGQAQLAWVDMAAQLTASGVAHAMVTGPVSKAAIASSEGGPAATRFLGHTEHLARMFGVERVVMAFWSEQLIIALATTHLRLRDVPGELTEAAVAEATYRVAEFVTRLRGKAPHVVVVSLNPHAGEQGLLGDEEASVIAPGIARARRMLLRAQVAATVEGPVGAETAIRQARGGAYDAVVAMYHDQATIPMKLLGFGESVNITLGLPIVRTSVDHGTGYDVAGKGTADDRGMRLAIELAARLSQKVPEERP